MVLQSFSFIPPIGVLLVYLIGDLQSLFVYFYLPFSVIPFVLIIITKYIVYGKFYIFKIEEGEENKLRDSSRKDDSKNSNQDFDDPPFPDGFWNIPPLVEDD